MKARILLVDDDAETRAVFRDALEHDGHEVLEVESAESALSKVTSFGPHGVVTDVRMGGMTGLELLEKLKEHLPDLGVVVVTAHEDMSSAVEAMKGGAFDYLVKPVSISALRDTVARLLRQLEVEDEGRRVEIDETGGAGLIGRDPRMIEIYKTIGTLSRNRATVLVRGETGTGKEMVARAIHEHSADGGEPFIAVNCTALTDTLLESELFGHVKGAFTGATSGRKGYFEMAGRGTIFLDEIGDTSAEFQTKLLRVLQERTFYPVGGEEPRRTEARVIAATHQPLERLVEGGDFREDLYFRLKVVEIEVPPLRDRPDDIAALVSHLLGRVREETGATVRGLSEDALEKLAGYDWPGNVRELENVLTRAAISARGSTIDAEHLELGRPSAFAGPAGPDGRSLPPDGDWTLDAAIARHLQAALEHTGGNKSETARILDISRSRLQRIIERHELEVPGD